MVAEEFRKVCENEEWGDWFDNNITWNNGEGNKILFWDNTWIGDLP